MFKKALKDLGYEIVCEYPLVYLSSIDDNVVLSAECFCTEQGPMLDSAFVFAPIGSEDAALLKELYAIHNKELYNMHKGGVL